MTRVYFVRHAKPDITIKDDMTRPLIKEALEDCRKVTNFLGYKCINKVYSSPYKRAIETIKDFATKYNHTIEIVNDFRERKIANTWIEDFNTYAERQWADFNYKLEDGESLSEVQARNILALNQILKSSHDKNIVIGTHGTALSTIINYYDNSYGYSDFDRIRAIMPFIVQIDFVGFEAVDINKIILD
jgi:2,3-bisphosphoglycerate-dependent phosphoglycerate mutase